MLISSKLCIYNCIDILISHAQKVNVKFVKRIKQLDTLSVKGHVVFTFLSLTEALEQFYCLYIASLCSSGYFQAFASEFSRNFLCVYFTCSYFLPINLKRSKKFFLLNFVDVLFYDRSVHI